ncbi:hypothetical protein LTR37_018555 [Vermiconidia calcicola]|uniref:Uncharacterized protein n=1 Tax=Vermiconidia calcicola TaxID=1690605 RepID=A0ACC3MGS3_9PEZI|nr:hypothetical protein LTR37_018555 [Vermiconidia calcicola]
MGNIYGCAERVLVWLGVPTEAYQLAADHVWQIIKRPLLADVSSSEDEDSVPSESRECQRLSGVRREEKRKALSDVSLRTVIEFFNRAWWSRVWVVQEVSRARRDPLLIVDWYEPRKNAVLVGLRISLQNRRGQRSKLFARLFYGKRHYENESIDGDQPDQQSSQTSGSLLLVTYP